jgi:uncharacterized membrane protein YjjP (DUF1212 family)
MSEEQYGQYGEKGEKEEKEDEKSWDEKWRRDPLTAAVWAMVLIWGGVVLLAANLGFLDGFFLDGWQLFFLGAAALLMLEVLVRLLVPSYRQPVIGSVILSLVFLGIGLGGLVKWYLLWPLVLIGLGVYILFSGLFRRRE